MSELVEIILRLRGGRQFEGQMDRGAKGVKRFGTQTEKAGRQSKGAWKTIGNGAAALGAAHFLKGTTDAVTELGKSTMMLQRSTGMDAKTSSAWVSMLKTRGIEAKQFNVGMVKMSKSMVDASTGGKKNVALFNDLGVSMDAVKSGDMQSVLLQTADGLSKMTNPAEKAAAAQQLLGKQGQALLPVFAQGSEGIKEQIGLADEFGATLSGKSSESIKELIQHERELQFAQMGVKVQLGTALLPLMIAFGKTINDIVHALGPLLRNSTALRIIVVGLISAFTLLKVAQVAAAFSTLGLSRALVVQKIQLVATKVWTLVVSAATKAWAAAQWLLNAALTANPIGLVIIAVVALGAAFVVAYKKVGWFRKAVQAVWGWLKRNWPLIVSILAGPLGIAVRLIVKHWDAIKDGARNAVHWVANQFRSLINFLKKIPAAIKGALGKTFDFVTGIGSTVAGGASDFAKGLIPGLAMGGPVQRTGAYMVGERGPEIVRLPRAAEVVPNHAISAAATGGGGATHQVVTQVFLDRRQIAEAMGNYTSDRMARR